MTVPNSQPARDVATMLVSLLDEGYEVRFASDPAGRGCLAALTGPLGSHAAGTGDNPAAALASVWPLDGDAPCLPGDASAAAGIDATAGAILAGKITALREYTGRLLAGEDQAAALEHIAGELGRISVILAAATEGTDDEDDTDDLEPYCSACGRKAGIFHGYEGWRHYRGEGTAASSTELYDAGHEVTGPMWCLPPGRALTPADMTVIRDALADAYASQWHRDEPGNERAGAYAALLDRLA